MMLDRITRNYVLFNTSTCGSGGKKKEKNLGQFKCPLPFCPASNYTLYIYIFSALNINVFFNIKYHARLHAYATCVGGATSGQRNFFFKKLGAIQMPTSFLFFLF